MNEEKDKGKVKDLSLKGFLHVLRLGLKIVKITFSMQLNLMFFNSAYLPTVTDGCTTHTIHNPQPHATLSL